ncbi:cation diffusion facilitator family transporter [Blattabacterium cuenoti]|uniref:cation diffusion facilitator family transporter n=1 Tax=Blattabacterium cuenoti TaxID=1653831 RepID=UPI00163BC600|nr:cation diffusion facilitator family transporter [Blattabacterium cuenoti]
MNLKKTMISSFFIQKMICFFAIILFCIKLITWRITSSLSIFSDAMESLTNIISSIIGLCSLYISSLPKDKNHPYGHGKIEFISTAIEGFLISVISFTIFINTFTRIRYNFYHKSSLLSKLDCGILLMFLTSIINYFLGFLACKIGNKNKTLTLIASGKHLKMDTYSTFGIAIGLIFLNKTKCIWIDPIISIILSFFILYTGFKLLRNATAGIMDETDKNLLKKLSFYLNEKRSIYWIDLHHLKIIKYGSALHIDCHLTVPWFFNIKEANKEVRKLTILTKYKFGTKVELSVHVDACSKFDCIFCFNKTCQVRKHPFHKKILWTLNQTSYIEKKQNYNKNNSKLIKKTL